MAERLRRHFAMRALDAFRCLIDRRYRCGVAAEWAGFDVGKFFGHFPSVSGFGLVVATINSRSMAPAGMGLLVIQKHVKQSAYFLHVAGDMLTITGFPCRKQFFHLLPGRLAIPIKILHVTAFEREAECQSITKVFTADRFVA